jgi:hypothetical protein
VIRESPSAANPDLEDWSERHAERANSEFFADALPWLAERVGNEARGAIVLLGQRDLPGIALRRAQSVLRWDRRPSLWSHAMLLVGGDRAREVTLHSRAGTFPEPAFNAVTDITLGAYDNRVVDANVALLGVKMDRDQNERLLERTTDDGVNHDRLRYDLWELLGLWQSYLWTRGTRNPLEEGIPMFNAAFVAYAYEAFGLDVTPGASERHAAPEHIWNGARWWSPEFRWQEDAEGRSVEAPAEREESPIIGCCCLRDRHCALLDPSR